jgi:hypothetical protein
MNRKIVEIDSQIARLRDELTRTQNEIENLAEERGRALAGLEDDTSFQRRISKGQNSEGPGLGK